MFPTTMEAWTPRTRTRTAPSGYEKLRIPFHALRTAQLVSSLVVGGIMSFFMYHLTHDDWPTPWTFIVLAVVSLLTVACLITTIVLHCFVGLNPIFNIVLNSSLAGLWAMGFGMLSYYMWGTLTHYCNLAYWHDGTGVMVCRIYKAVFSFSLLGLVSTLAALALDLHIRRLAQRGGKHYRLEDLDHKRRVSAIRSPYADADSHRLSEEDISRTSGAFEVPTQGYGAQSTIESRRIKEGGYTVPENQFDYDTGYHGHGEQIGEARYGTR